MMTAFVEALMQGNLDAIRRCPKADLHNPTPGHPLILMIMRQAIWRAGRASVLGIRLPSPKEGGRAIGEYDHHNHHDCPDEDDRKVHLAMISAWGLFD
jgi:hypothetical protein